MHPGPKGVKSICFLGQPVCVAAISRLVGLGTERVTKMRRAFRQREDCPTDGRLFGKARRFGDKKQTAKREVVHDFLHYLYTEVSEPMPETVTDVHEGQSLSTIVPRMLRFRKARGKRPKMFEKRAKEKIDEEGAKKVRFLPPGSFTDYLKLLRARVPDVHVSLKLFCKEPLDWTRRVFLCPEVFLWPLNCCCCCCCCCRPVFTSSVLARCGNRTMGAGLRSGRLPNTKLAQSAQSTSSSSSA